MLVPSPTSLDTAYTSRSARTHIVFYETSLVPSQSLYISINKHAVIAQCNSKLSLSATPSPQRIYLSLSFLDFFGRLGVVLNVPSGWKTDRWGVVGALAYGTECSGGKPATFSVFRFTASSDGL
jgi:hypothetical protein